MLSYKKRFHDAVGLHSNRSLETSNCGKNITISCASCATFLFLPQFGVICDLLLNRPTAFVNLFVKRRPNLMRMFDFLSAYSIFFFLTHSCRGWWGWMRLLAREIGTYKCALKDDTESAKQRLSKLVSFINPDTETLEQNRLWAQESVPTNEWHITKPENC